MRILLHKTSDDRHGLEIIRDDGGRERVECETRSYLLHDLLHYAVECEAGLTRGFWGALAAGEPLGQTNLRDTAPSRVGVPVDPERAAIEQIVGALHGSTKGLSAAELAAGMRRFAESLGQPLPAWLTEAFILAVQERLRQLVGRWRATRYRETMELDWPPA
jgi:hypothetical protein